MSGYKKVGRRLRRFRRLARLKQITVAKKLNLEGNAAISRWERNKSLPDLEQAIALSNLYHTTVNDLFPAIDAHFKEEFCSDSTDEINFDNGP